MHHPDTIFALATPPGRSGVAVLRISGPRAHEALAALGCPLPASRLATLAPLLHPQTKSLIDRALVLRFDGPASFTGEDVVELQLHGSRAVIGELLGILSALPGLHMAEAGEFSRRAVMNGKMDLTQAEGLADLIEAETISQKQQAQRIVNGEAAAFYDLLRAEILRALALVEAYIDFPDEEIPDSVLAQVHASVAGLIHTIERELLGGRDAERIREGISVVILGAPNVGKSSLMNALARRDVAIVSATAGTTRDLIEVHLDMAGLPVVLVDTAGLRRGDNDIEEEGIRRAIRRAESADVKILLLDASELPNLNPQSLELIDATTLVVFNKIELASSKIPAEVRGQKTIGISVKENRGVAELVGLLKETTSALHNPSAAPFITRARHRQLLSEAHRSLQQFLRGGKQEIMAEELRLAAASIGKITGRILVDELLDVIFSTFCIGK